MPSSMRLQAWLGFPGITTIVAKLTWPHISTLPFPLSPPTAADKYSHSFYRQEDTTKAAYLKEVKKPLRGGDRKQRSPDFQMCKTATALTSRPCRLTYHLYALFSLIQTDLKYLTQGLSEIHWEWEKSDATGGGGKIAQAMQNSTQRQKVFIRWQIEKKLLEQSGAKQT